jgi:transcriptional regulator
MLVHPWDAARDDAEWQAWLADGHDFGTLVAAGRGRDVPVVVPTHFAFDGDRTVVLHLARPNPVWRALEENPWAVLSVVGDVAYVPSAWKAVDGEDPALGVPTSYYAAVQLAGPVEVVDRAEVLRTQLKQMEPGSGVADPQEQARLLPGIRAVRLRAEQVAAKFKFGGNADARHQEQVAERLAERGTPADLAARAHLLRRAGRLAP